MTEKNISARDFVEAKDVKGNILYRKDGYIMGYLRIYFFNLDLKSNIDRKSITEKLTAAFKDDRRNFVYLTLPREIDLDNYKDLLKRKHKDTENLGKRHILANMMIEGTRLSTNGDNFEHQHFIKIWEKKTGESTRAEEAIVERLKDFKRWFSMAEIETSVLTETEIIKLCNLFGNSLQASYEPDYENSSYMPIPQISVKQM